MPTTHQIFLTTTMWSILASLAAEDSGNGLGRHKQLYAVPAPGPVVIDGTFADWDLSGQIEMFVIGETKGMQSAKFALMYDSEAVYLSGVVRDPTPMMNRQDPLVRGGRGWDADSCQFRMTIDPTLPYPVMIAHGNGDMANTNLVHLTMWHFTDRELPCLQMQTSMNYTVPRTEWGPFGVVPADAYSAKYVKATDGLGYAFEYRIPWATMGAKKPLKGGDDVAGTVQFNWGLPDGLASAGAGAWAYDVMSGPGFTYQNAGVWGRIHLSPTGKVAKELVEAGVPAERPLPLEFSYDLPRDGQITVQLVDDQKLVRRILVPQADRRAGRNIERWDGLDDHGKPMTPGTYTVQGIIHQPITSSFVFSAHNSGQPPYPTDDGKGGWGGDHGSPRSCNAIPGGMLLGWDGSEYGWGTIRVDAEGRKQWGTKTNALLLANDGTRYFAYDPQGFQSAQGIQVFNLADGRPINFGNGSPLLKSPPLPENSADKSLNDITGLAYAAGSISVAYAKRNLIAVYDGISGELKQTWTVPAAGALAARADGTLVVLSAGALHACVDGKLTLLNRTDLDDPQSLAVGADGSIFITNRGTRQDIAVCTPDGKLLRRIGRAGGRPAVGAYDRSGMFQPAGIAVDATGHVWVAENADSPKRISVWNAASSVYEREFFGGSDYFGYAAIDPAKPNEIVCHNVLWKIDWDAGTTAPISTIWRKTSADMIEEAAPGAYWQGLRIITATDGKQYGLGVGARKTILYRRDGDLFKPFLATMVGGGQGIPELDDPAKVPGGQLIWQDANDDQRVQVGEIVSLPPAVGNIIKAVAKDLTLWTNSGQVLKPQRRLANGQPVYDAAKAEATFLSGTRNVDRYLWLAEDDTVFTLPWNGQLSHWKADGTLDWGFPGIPGWADSLGLPVVKAGRLHGLTDGLGAANGFTGTMTYFGPCHLFNRDGIYSAAIMRDSRLGGLGADVGQPEGQGGGLVSLHTKPGGPLRTFVLAGGQDGRVTEVHGLDTIEPLTLPSLTISAAEIKHAVDELAAYNVQAGMGPKLRIAADAKTLEGAAGVTTSLDGTRRFTVKMARTATHLLVNFTVVSPTALISAATDPKLLFKSGNCLDIQIATDPTADPKRTKPAPGDVRLLVTLHDGKPYAVLYRPKVAGFTGQPTVLSSPTGTESFDEIRVVEVGLNYRPHGEEFFADLSIPLELIGLKLTAGTPLRLDLGYLYGNATGNQVAARRYVFNNSFSANVVNDVPNESRLEPAAWGSAEVE